MGDLPFFVIGKNYKIYKKKIGRTYESQKKSKYVLTYSKKHKLNPNFLKCVEIFINKRFRREFIRFFRRVYHINVLLHYFYHRFYQYLARYSSSIFDKHFSIPYKGKVRDFDYIMTKFSEVTTKGKRELFYIIVGLKKHNYEKRIFHSLKKRRRLPLEQFIKRLENEKYLPFKQRTKLIPKIHKWLMTHVYEDMANEKRESFARPRVIIEKREDLIEETYPYLPRYPVRFQRDIKNENFKKTKILKYKIINLTKRKVIFQSHYFRYYKDGSKLISRNLIKTKANSKINIPIRIQRLYHYCTTFYRNLLKENGYVNFIRMIVKFKTLYLYNPKFKNKTSSFIMFFLTLVMSPLFRGISKEREYAHDLKVFLNNYLIRLRLFKRYQFLNSFTNLKGGYILPIPKYYKFLKKLRDNSLKIMHKRQDIIFSKFMYRKSFKRLTIRIRSKASMVAGIMPLYKYNFMASDGFSPINLKKKFLNNVVHVLLQPNIDYKVKTKYRLYISALKRSYNYSAAYHTDARLYYYTPYNLFIKKFEKEVLPEEDFIAKYKEIIHDKFTL